MTALRATVRLQLHAGFDLDAAAAQVPYYADLGISHVYLSPIATARAGSTHGYDVIDPTRVNPELGGEEALRRLVAALRAHAMGAIVDIVPNHMAADVANPWWRDVLACGRQSPFAAYFDIDWDAPGAGGRLVLPILDTDVTQAIADGQLALACPPTGDPVVLACADQALPLSAASLCVLLDQAGAELAIHSRSSALAACAGLSGPATAGALGAAVARVNASPPALHELLELQHYALLGWREANGRVNYRRFFDINGLAALAVECPKVLAAVHALPLRLIAEGLVDGLRVDHVDGLSMPGTYLHVLRRAVDLAARQRPATVPAAISIHVEKILARDEELPADWQVDGTTGYDFMAQVGALLHDPNGALPLQAAWARLTGAGADVDFEREERAARTEVLAQKLSSEWSRCARAWAAANHGKPEPQAAAAPDPSAMRGAVGQVLQALRVYRSYLADGVDAAGAKALAAAFAQAGQLAGDTFAAGRARLHALLLGSSPVPPHAYETCRRLEQTAAALDAKAVEDTCFYRYGVLLSRNEVGSDPRQFACSPEAFHAAMMRRAARWPGSLLATATHDHKRGEDARARLAALSGRADDYVRHAGDWLRELRAVDPLPAATDLWMLLQTLVAHWPLTLAVAEAEASNPMWRDFAARIGQWQQKALREGGQHTSWLQPDAGYETACQRVTQALLLDERCAALRARIGAWAHGLDAAGALAGLVAVALRCTVPGVPDLYQGTECWDQSLVDPDNRRPVDYALRRGMLDDDATPRALLRGFRDGRLKQHVIRRLLDIRREHPALFAAGDYVQLQVAGNTVPLVAFLRRHRNGRLLVAVPLGFARCAAPAPALPGPEPLPMPPPATEIPLPAPDGWRDARVVMADAPVQDIAWRDVFTGTTHRARENTLPLAPLFAHWPIAVLHASIPDREDEK